MSHLEHPVAVLAGTPVDTKMGADVLTAHGIVPLMYPVSSDPREQNYFQVLSLEEKHKVLRGLLTGAMAHGCESAFIYCNSLSGSVYFPALAEELGLKIVTPMDVYGALAVRYSKLAIIAANSQALAAQHGVMTRANPRILTMCAVRWICRTAWRVFPSGSGGRAAVNISGRTAACTRSPFRKMSVNRRS